MHNRMYQIKIGILLLLAISAVCLFMFTFIEGNWQYILNSRFKKVSAILLTGAAIAFSTVIFQTITTNRILTPSMIGLDSLYLLIQTFIVYVFGSMSIPSLNPNINFLISVGLMVLFSGLLYKVLFRREGNHIYFLLLVGIVFGTLFGSMSRFMQVLIDPNEFLIVQDRMFASFNNVNVDLLRISLVVLVLAFLYSLRYAKYLDVLALGKQHALNLGVPYDKVVKRLLIVISIMISVSTALVGPITFLGLLVANVSYEFMKTHRHSYTITGAILLSFIALVGGQWIVEKVFTFSTSLSVIVNFIGGVYFLFLLLRENKSWS